MTTLQAGAELDAAVARACGVKGWIYSQVQVPNPKSCFLLDDGGYRWSPSTDLNAAFEAADRVRLFSDDCVLRKVDGKWSVDALEASSNDAGYFTAEEWTNWATADTAALCICRAILFLKGVA